MKAKKAYALVDEKGMIVPELIVSPQKVKWYKLQKGEKWVEVTITPKL